MIPATHQAFQAYKKKLKEKVLDADGGGLYSPPYIPYGLCMDNVESVQIASAKWKIVFRVLASFGWFSGFQKLGNQKPGNL